MAESKTPLRDREDHLAVGLGWTCHLVASLASKAGSAVLVMGASDSKGAGPNPRDLSGMAVSVWEGWLTSVVDYRTVRETSKNPSAMWVHCSLKHPEFFLK